MNELDFHKHCQCYYVNAITNNLLKTCNITRFKHEEYFVCVCVRFCIYILINYLLLLYYCLITDLLYRLLLQSVATLSPSFLAC